MTLTAATLTMENAATGGRTSYPADLTAAVGAGAGVLGVTAVYAAGALTFPSVDFPDGTYLGVGPLDTSPVYPARVCVSWEFPISLFVGGTSIPCTHQVCYAATFLGATTGGTIGPLSGHDGLVTFTTAWSAA